MEMLAAVDGENLRLVVRAQGHANGDSLFQIGEFRILTVARDLRFFGDSVLMLVPFLARRRQFVASDLDQFSIAAVRRDRTVLCLHVNSLSISANSPPHATTHQLALKKSCAAIADARILASLVEVNYRATHESLVADGTNARKDGMPSMGRVRVDVYGAMSSERRIGSGPWQIEDSAMLS
jgi:hypothetical protein